MGSTLLWQPRVGQLEKGYANEIQTQEIKESHTGNPLELGEWRKWFIHIPRGRGFLAGSRLLEAGGKLATGCTITLKTGSSLGLGDTHS